MEGGLKNSYRQIPHDTRYYLYPRVVRKYPQLCEEASKIQSLVMELELTRPKYFLSNITNKYYRNKAIRRLLFLYDVKSLRESIEKRKREFNMLEELIVKDEDKCSSYSNKNRPLSSIFWVA